MYIEDCIFKNTNKFKKSSLIATNENIYGTYMFIILDVNLTIWNTRLQDGVAIQGGAIYLSGDSSMTILNSQLTGNTAKA